MKATVYWCLLAIRDFNIYSPLAKTQQGCGFATPSLSSWCPQCLRGTVHLGSGAFASLHLPDSRTSSLTTNWSQWVGSAEERQYGEKGDLTVSFHLPQVRVTFPLVLLELLPLVFANRAKDSTKFNPFLLDLVGIIKEYSMTSVQEMTTDLRGRSRSHSWGNRKIPEIYWNERTGKVSAKHLLFFFHEGKMDFLKKK